MLIEIHSNFQPSSVNVEFKTKGMELFSSKSTSYKIILVVPPQVMYQYTNELAQL